MSILLVQHQPSPSPKGRNRLRCTAALALVACTSLAACGEAPAANTETNTVEQAIIGGFVATSPTLNHTGMLVGFDPVTSDTVPLCTATLVAPEVIVTANHCAQVYQNILFNGLRVGFGVGPDGNAPERLVEVVLADTSGGVGGFVGAGRDVSVGYLAEPIEGVAPVEIGMLDSSQSGTRSSRLATA